MKKGPFRSLKIDTPCRESIVALSICCFTDCSFHPPVLFFKTSEPVVPVDFVLSFCRNAASHPERKLPGIVRRLTPITLVGKATEKGLVDLATQVLAPHFHGDAPSGRKVSTISCEPHLPFPHPDLTECDDRTCMHMCNHVRFLESA